MYLAKVDPMITISNYNKTSTKIKKITNNFLLENGRVPDSLELIDIIKEKHDIDVKDESDVYQLDISSITSEDGEYDLSYKTNSMCSENDYNSTIDSDFSKQTIDSLMVFLKPKEKEVIKLLFGIDSFRPLELYEVAQQLNMTDDGIKCIKVRALSKMKNNFKNINV
jgi:RNA polymerase primary sigma factor